MTKWSGLAPAVNAHLRRWKKVKDEFDRLQRAVNTGRGIDGSQMPIAGNWAVFARTWGLPQPDGSIVTPTVAVEGMTINGREQFQYTPASEQNSYALMEREHKMLRSAETVYVSADIVDRVTRAAESMDPEPLFHTDMFTPAGMLILEKPLLIPDYHPRSGVLTDYLHVAMRGLSWGPETISVDWDKETQASVPGIMLMSYSTNEDWRDSYYHDMRRALADGKMTPSDVGMTFNGAPVTLEEFEQTYFDWTMASGIPRDMLTPMDAMGWSFGRQWQAKDRPEHEPGMIDTPVAYVRRWFLALMRFAWQRLLVHEHPRLSPKAQKRLVSEFKKPKHEFSVLRLRRTTERTDESGTGTGLQWRVQTRGHWRRVYVPTLGPARLEDGAFNDDSHRLKWIEPFWRGPLDAPLGPLHKATVIVR